MVEVAPQRGRPSGAFADQLESVEALLESVDDQTQPLEAGWLRVQRSRLWTLTELGSPSPGEARIAVELTRSSPSSWQHAYAEAGRPTRRDGEVVSG